LFSANGAGATGNLGQHRGIRLFSANGAKSIRSLGQRPRSSSIRPPKALKARFISAFEAIRSFNANGAKAARRLIEGAPVARGDLAPEVRPFVDSLLFR
jgi:hypothetical protein